MKKINTILFDLDGTLLDTNELNFQSYIHTFERFFPGEYTRETVVPFYGETLQVTFSKVAKDQAMTDEMLKTYRNFNIDKHDEMAVAFDDVEEVLEILHNAGYKMAIVTSKKKDFAMRGLKIIGIDKYFDEVVSYDCVKNPKPDAEPIHLALAKLGKTSDEAVMIGDNHQDIVSGKNAGTKTICVGWTIHEKAKMEKYNPDYFIEKMFDLLTLLKVL